MGRKKGVVLEVHGNEAVVLTDNGEFQRVKLYRRQVEVGMEIRIPEKSRFKYKWTNWVAVAAMFLFAIVPIMALQNDSDQVMAYVSVEINPSVELAIGENKKVLGADPYNSDGARILRERPIVGLSVDDAVAAITEQAITDGYINKERENAVLIAMAPAQGQVLENGFETELLQAASSVIEKNQLVATVEAFYSSSELRLAAKDKGVSVGRYTVVLEANANNVELSVDDIKHNSIGEVIKEKGLDPNKIINKERTTEDYTIIAKELDTKQDKNNDSDLAVAVNKEDEQEKDKEQDKQSTKPEGQGANKPSNNTVVVEEPGNPDTKVTISTFPRPKPSTSTKPSATTKPPVTTEPKVPGEVATKQPTGEATEPTTETKPEVTGTQEGPEAAVGETEGQKQQTDTTQQIDPTQANAQEQTSSEPKQ